MTRSQWGKKKLGKGMHRLSGCIFISKITSIILGKYDLSSNSLVSCTAGQEDGIVHLTEGEHDRKNMCSGEILANVY